MDFSCILRIIAMLTALVQLIFFNVAYGTTIIPGEEEIMQPVLENNIEGDSTMSATILFAANARNAVQGAYTDGSRSAYEMSNPSAHLIHQLCGSKNATLKIQRVLRI